MVSPLISDSERIVIPALVSASLTRACVLGVFACGLIKTKAEFNKPEQFPVASQVPSLALATKLPVDARNNTAAMVKYEYLLLRFSMISFLATQLQVSVSLVRIVASSVKRLVIFVVVVTFFN